MTLLHESWKYIHMNFFIYLLTYIMLIHLRVMVKSKDVFVLLFIIIIIIIII
jgi:hypothetical protein